MSTLFTYDFADGASPACLIPGHHWNPNQSPGLPGSIAVLGWIYDGAGGSYANDDLVTVFRYNRFPGTPDYKATLAVTFPTVALADRSVDLFIRMVDPDNAYKARLRTNFGAPEVELFRVAGGVETSIAGPAAAGALADLTPADLAVEAVGDTLTVWVDGVEKLQVTEAEADLLNGDERVGWGAEFGNPPLGPTVSDLRVTDRADESGKEGAFLLQVNEETWDLSDMDRDGISIERFTLSHFGPGSATILVNELATAPRWKPEDRVLIKAEVSPPGYTVVFRGRIRDRRRVGQPPTEAVEYFAADPRAGAKYVIPAHPDTNTSTITWNALDGQDGYSADYSGKTVGEILKWYFDEFVDELRAHGAADPEPSSVPYVQADLDALTVIPTRLDLVGDFEQVVMALLALVPDVAMFVEPDTWLWRFVAVQDLTPAKDLPFEEDGRSIRLQVADETADRFTAVRVRSIREEVKELKVGTVGGGLTNLWNSALEQDWTPSRSNRSALSGLTLDALLDSGTDNPRLQVSVPTGSKLYPSEWAGCLVTFTSGAASGRSYTVEGNTSTIITLNLVGGFPAGDPPVEPLPGDGLKVEDSRTNATATSENGFSYVFRRFQVADPTKRNLAKNACAAMWGEKENPNDPNETRQTAYSLKYETTPGVIVTGAPLVIYFRDIAPAGRCETGGDYGAGNALLEGKYKEITVLEVRVPATGWRGTCYAEDASKWNGGGDPGPDDWGIRREALLEDPEWIDSGQSDGVQAAATAWLAARMNKPYNGEAVLTGLDWDFRVLQKPVTFSSTDPLRGATAGDLETAFIYPFEVTYLPRANQTLLVLGDRGEFGRQYQDLLAKQREAGRNALIASTLRRMEEIQECFEAQPHDKATARDDNPVCATEVRGNFQPRPGGGDPPSDLKKKIEELQELVGGLLVIINRQKEVGEAPDDPNWPGDALPPGAPGGGGSVLVSVGSVDLWQRRTFGTFADEWEKLQADPANARIAAYGRDRGHVVTGRGEPNLAAFHHKHQRDVFEAMVGPPNQTFTCRNTIMAETDYVFFRDGAATSLVKLDPGPGVMEYSIGPDNRTVTLLLPVTNPGAALIVEYATQGDIVRRSETLLAEALPAV